MQSKKFDVVVKSDGAIYRGVRFDRAWVWEWICDVSVNPDRVDQCGSAAHEARQTQPIEKLE
jgi:hypothetical protein